MALITFGRYARDYFRCQLENDPGYRYATYVLGIQGTGKSTLLGQIAEQCVAAGEGVLVVDIIGELAEDLASRTQFPDKLIYVAPAAHLGAKRYWALNPLELDWSIPGANDRLVSQVRQLFDRMELANTDRMPQIRHNLNMAARLAVAIPEPTLPDLLRLFQDEPFRTALYAHPAVAEDVRRHWLGYDRMTDRQRREITNSTLTRLQEFLSAEVVGRMVTPRQSTIRLADWLDAGKLVVCNLGRAYNVELGAEISKLLGNFLIAQLTAAAYTRPSLNQEKRRIWRVLVDEFQELAGESFTEIITQTRKYQVFPVLAHQNLSQLNDALTNAVMSCAVRLFLRTSGEDAGLVRRLFHDNEGHRLAGYPNFQARAHLPEPDGRTRYEVLELADWWAPRSQSQLAQAIGRAEEDHFTHPEDWFTARVTPSTPPSMHRPGGPNGAGNGQGGQTQHSPNVSVHPGSSPPRRAPAQPDPTGSGHSVPPRPVHVFDKRPGG